MSTHNMILWKIRNTLFVEKKNNNKQTLILSYVTEF